MNWIDYDELKTIMLEFDGITEKEAKIIGMWRNNYTYSHIQIALGNPSKQEIKWILRKWIKE